MHFLISVPVSRRSLALIGCTQIFENKVVFADGSEFECDAIVACTGRTRHITSHHITSITVMSCHIMSCHVMSHQSVQCHAYCEVTCKSHLEHVVV